MHNSMYVCSQDPTLPQPGETKAAAALRLTRSALVRSHMERGRLDMKREAWADAEVSMRKVRDNLMI